MADMTATTADEPTPRLFTRAEALALLKIGETTLFWLQRTGKLKFVRIGRRVLFNAAEIRRLAVQGATLSEAEKQAVANNKQKQKRASGTGRPRKALVAENAP